MKKTCVILSTVLTCLMPHMTFAAVTESAIKAVNAEVDALEKRISSEDKSLQILTAALETADGASEGVPPNLKFYFETKKSATGEKAILRVCKKHIGLEVSSRSFIYYFGEDGKLVKYLELISGVAGAPGAAATRNAIIYDKAGKAIWKSGNVEMNRPSKEIHSLFQTLEKSLEN